MKFVRRFCNHLDSGAGPLHWRRRGQLVTVSIDPGDGSPIRLAGTAVYEEWCDGFGLGFGSMTPAQLQTVKGLMGRLRSIRRTA